MFIFYQVAEVCAGVIPEGFIPCIDIPLKGSEKYFEVYQAKLLPCFD
jgi:hypothetical protein